MLSSMSCLSFLVSWRTTGMSRVGLRDLLYIRGAQRSQGGLWPGGGGGTKKRGGRGQKGDGKIDSRKERWDEVGCQEESWMMPECIQLLNLHLNCCFICCGPALCSAGFPARSWDWFNEEVQRWLDLLMAWGPGVWAASTSQRFPLREARIS